MDVANATTGTRIKHVAAAFANYVYDHHTSLDQPWAAGTDWSFAGSDEDKTVSKDSGIDKGYHADHKYRYRRDADYDVSHTNIRLLGPGRAKFNLRYWHASEGEPHDTTNGWSPLETAYNTLDRDDNW